MVLLCRRQAGWQAIQGELNCKGYEGAYRETERAQPALQRGVRDRDLLAFLSTLTGRDGRCSLPASGGLIPSVAASCTQHDVVRFDQLVVVLSSCTQRLRTRLQNRDKLLSQECTVQLEHIHIHESLAPPDAGTRAHAGRWQCPF